MSTNSGLVYENNVTNGPLLHFTNIHPQDVFLIGMLMNAEMKKYNKNLHRIFRQRHTRVTAFSMETFATAANSLLLGQDGQAVEINLKGDFVYGQYFTFIVPAIELTQTTTMKKFAYVTNYGHACLKKATSDLDNHRIDQNTSEQLLTQQQAMKRTEQLQYINEFVGNTKALCEMTTATPESRIEVPLRFFNSESAQKAFPKILGGSTELRNYLSLRTPGQVVCCTRNAESENWNEHMRIGNVNIITHEAFVGEQERILLSQSPKSTFYLFEQNLISEGPAKDETSLHFQHPCKYMLWYVRKDKYCSGKHYLAYNSFLNGTTDTQRLLTDATLRFIYRFARYKVSGIDFSTSTDDGTDLTSVVVTEVFPAFDVDDDGKIVSIFYDDSNQIITQDTTTYMDIDDVFQNIIAYPSSKTIAGVAHQVFAPEGLFITGSLLTIEQASITMEQFESQFKYATLTDVTITDATNIVKANKATVPQSITSDEFSIYQNLKFADGTYTSDSVYPFSKVSGNIHFNEGHRDFDVRVYQWDNFGKNLNKEGQLVETSEMLINGISRFKVNQYNSSKFHFYNFFPGHPQNGIHGYSFCLDPTTIQPLGMFNLTKGQPKFAVTYATGAVDKELDKLFVNAVCYNIMQFQRSTTHILYQTNIQ